ncbi:MAG TPA: hypothetical protein VL400_01485 [Polyangiaceae bacterium]|nr:hypothetical protein [Polyangiaceae bacterium]
MLRFRRRSATIALGLGLGALLLGDGGVEVARAAPVAAPRVEVALLSGAPLGDATDLRWITPDVTGLPAPVATIRHRKGAAVRGAVTPTGDVAVVADTAAGDDLSFAASLFAIERGKAPRVVADRLVHAQRPLALPDGRVVVARGTAGTAPRPGAARVDDLTLDVVDLASGKATTLLSAHGYLLFTAGFVDGAVVVYRITETGADLVSVEPKSGGVTTLLASMPPFARDFSVDPAGGRVVFVDRHPTDARTWQLVALETKTRATQLLAESPSIAMMPTVLDDGDVAIAEGDRVKRLSGKALDLPAPGALAITGRATASGRTWLAGTVSEHGKIGRPVVVGADGRDAWVCPAPAGERVAVAGLRVRGAK